MRAAPLDAAAFAALMARLAPFEPQPHLAVGVSGGADSLALALLAHEWARGQGGRITALTVDHGLRPDSGAEAARVGAWLGGHGISHAILPWIGAKPTSAVQARARDARRALLAEWCRAAGVLHLLLAHQRDDQAETVLLRRQSQSGPDGLAAMAAIVELPALRILRPLLGLSHASLTTFLAARGQDWIEDPSNQNLAFTRIRLRRALDDEQAAALADGAAAAGRVRAAHEREVARLLARSVTIFPQGWASLSWEDVSRADASLSQAVLARVLRTSGGGANAPRGDGLARLHRRLIDGALGGGCTLAGCRVVPWKGRILVAREARACPEVPLTGPGLLHWDDRFAITIGEPAASGVALRIGPLGQTGWAFLARYHKPVRCLPIPHAARLALPALKDLDGVREVPHLLYSRAGNDPVSVVIKCADFQPLHPLAGPEFATF
jgi:tRNA(Ile)-lysidine synthase